MIRYVSMSYIYIFIYIYIHIYIYNHIYLQYLQYRMLYESPDVSCPASSSGEDLPSVHLFEGHILLIHRPGEVGL